ncbi:MAG TPA: hypothetical protein VGJ28_10340, partial [Micromonosporaceae bacterium]
MQLNEMVNLVTSDEPPPRYDADSIIAAGRRSQRRRRAGWAGAGTLAVVAVVTAAVVGVPAVVGHSTKSHPVAPAALPRVTNFPVASDPFTFTFGAFDSGKFQVQTPIVASDAYQIASVYETGRVTYDHAVPANTNPPKVATPIIYAYLTLYRPGAFDPSGVTGGHRTTIDGRPVVEAVAPGPTGDITHTTLGWEYPNDVWAVVESFSNSDSDPSLSALSRLVNGLHPSTPQPVTVPFTMNYVPSGYKLIETGTHSIAGLDGVAGRRDGDYGGAIFAKPAPSTTGLSAPYGSDFKDLPGSFTVFVVPAAN